MGRKPFVPSKLLRGVFSIDDANRTGLKRWHLEGASWARLGPSLYVPSGLRDSPIHQIEAARRRLPAGSAFSGLTAAWLHGLDVGACNPIEVTVEADAGVSARTGMTVRRSSFGAGDIIDIRGLPVTSLVRTIGELCSRLALLEAVVVADQALHKGGVRVEDLKAWAASHAGSRGIENFRRALSLAEPAAESPMESRLRMVLIFGGLPRPKAQVSIRDGAGRVIGRPDLYYERERLGIEYDGGIHRDQLVEDNRRQNQLLNADVRLLRFTAADVLRDSDRVVREVKAALGKPASAGSRGIAGLPKPASAGSRGERAG